VIGFDRAAQRREESRIAGAVGVQKAQQIGIGLFPGLLNGRAVAAVALKADYLDFMLVRAGDFERAIGRAVADHRDVHLVHRRGRGDVFPRGKRALDDRLDALLLVIRRDGNQ